MKNTLYYGDNLDILRRYVKDESVDLIYLDPPFKSNQDYNVLFAEQDGSRAAAQIMAFEDTWRWDEAAARAYDEVVTEGGRVSDVMRAFHTFLGGNDMLAYLSMMAPRLVELRRVLKSTGSIYLHCDPTASHYLKLLMDAVFDQRNFRNEIVWKRTQAHNDPKRCGNVHDVLLNFVKDKREAVWYGGGHEISDAYLKSHYSNIDERGKRYQLVAASGPGPGPARRFFGKLLEPPAGRHWTWTQEKIDKMIKEGRIVLTRTGMPRLIQYAPETVPLQDMWSDIDPVNSQAAERLGYPTQKPEALLERILNAGSKEGDVVLDPFCGCGTAVAVAQKLNRKWIGIDITHLAMTLIKKRLKDSYDILPHTDYAVVGEPVDLSGAKQLAEDDKYQFQWWALGLVNARPVEQKKGADQGIDGRRYFLDHKNRTHEQIIFSVKGGGVTASQVRDLVGVITREKAAIGAIICLEKPTAPMRKEAASAGFYESDYQNTKHPRLQIITIEELLEGKQLDLPALANMPSQDRTFKKAPKTRRGKKQSESFDLDDE